jgi:hypothetical protein
MKHHDVLSFLGANAILKKKKKKKKSKGGRW